MKNKLITVIVAAAILVGVSGISASAWSHGPMMGMGNGMMNGSGATVENNQKFLADTKGMRIQIAADQAELNALMAGPNPDSARVRELAESMAENQIAIQDMSGSNVHRSGQMNRMHMRGPGMMHGGYGGCNW
jgi:Spy/CpxP family protein refolding chaperone